MFNSLLSKWAQASAGGGVVTVLKADGKVLEFPRRLKCSELLLAFPSHCVYPATAVVLKQQGKMVAPDAYLEAGRTYFLLSKSGGANGGKPQQFAISKKHVAKIMQEANAGKPARPVLKRNDSAAAAVKKSGESGTGAARKAHAQQQQPAAVKRALARRRFVSSLSTIPEVAAI